MISAWKVFFFCLLLVVICPYFCLTDVVSDNGTYVVPNKTKPTHDEDVHENENHTETIEGHSHDSPLHEALNDSHTAHDANDTLNCILSVAGFNWHHVQNPMVIGMFLFFSALLKIIFHHAGFLVTKIPESCLLIVLGTIVGSIFTFGTGQQGVPDELKTLKPDLFFLVLLPPIVLEASYSLHNRVFFDNLGSILVFAAVGTLLNFAIIGPSLWLLSEYDVLGGVKISFIHCMLFASIIVAVDPVAVLAIFQEIGVNSVLYFLVFGESLLNDAVTVVLYQTVEKMNCMHGSDVPITVETYLIATAKLVVSSVGGILIGILFGVITSYLTKYTVETRVVEPLIVFALAYLAYVTADMFLFSGIVALTVCGLIQAQYAFHNISHKSYVTVKYFIRMASSASDSVIFLYLGLNLVRFDHVWHTGFIIATVLLTLVGRFVVTYGLAAIVNLSRLRQISGREQFIMAYGGLRGAVAFSLISLLSGSVEADTQTMFMTTTLIIVIFTVFVQGGTIKPLVSLLDIRKANKDGTLLLFEELNSNVTDHLMAGIEEIVGNHGQAFFYDFLMHLDDKYIKHKLQRNPLRKDEKIMKLYEKIALKQHFATIHGVEAAEKMVVSGEEEMPAVASSEDRVVAPPSSFRRPSMMSQLTRYGTIAENLPSEEMGDLALITPEMLTDDVETTHERRVRRQQSVLADKMSSGMDLRGILSRPNSRTHSRLPRGTADPDERTDMMAALQEKTRRLDRLRKSQSRMDSVSYMVPIQEQIVRRNTVKEDEGSSSADRNRNMLSPLHILKMPSQETEKRKRLRILHTMDAVDDQEVSHRRNPEPDNEPNNESNNALLHTATWPLISEQTERARKDSPDTVLEISTTRSEANQSSSDNSKSRGDVDPRSLNVMSPREARVTSPRDVEADVAHRCIERVPHTIPEGEREDESKEGDSALDSDRETNV